MSYGLRFILLLVKKVIFVISLHYKMTNSKSSKIFIYDNSVIHKYYFSFRLNEILGNNLKNADIALKFSK